MYRNPKIGKIFDRLPILLDYVLRENAEKDKQVKHDSTVKNKNIVIRNDPELVA